jgi:hypothetical protein
MAMNVDLGSTIMDVLSSRLSITLADLKSMLSAPEPDLEQALRELETGQFIQQSADPVTGSTLIAPTSKGILAARGLSKYAFKKLK